MVFPFHGGPQGDFVFPVLTTLGYVGHYDLGMAHTLAKNTIRILLKYKLRLHFGFLVYRGLPDEKKNRHFGRNNCLRST